MRIRWGVCGLVVVLAVVVLGACAKKKPPVARPVPPPPPMEEPATPTKPPAPPEPAAEKPVAPDADEGRHDGLAVARRPQPRLAAAARCSSATTAPRSRPRGRRSSRANAELLKKYPTWVITIEGHCDERGTAEYNLALGERRAVAARTYLVSLGIPADRVKVVSYGKEFPFDPGNTEEA